MPDINPDYPLAQYASVGAASAVHVRLKPDPQRRINLDSALPNLEAEKAKCMAAIRYSGLSGMVLVGN